MSDRKKDHIKLAFQAMPGPDELDQRFFYEPALSRHPDGETLELDFLGKKLKAPLWISSMTGGTEAAGRINRNLAMACSEFGLGMGLGSCRALLESNEHIDDFDLRGIIGDDLPLYANLGIAQVEKLLLNNELDKIEEMTGRLKTDGLIIHINPLQEWLQPEGNRLTLPAVKVVREFLKKTSKKLIVKEVGQGMGPGSLKALMKLPLDAIEFGAFGGTNFASLELMRSEKQHSEYLKPLARLGHTAGEMVDFVNKIAGEEDLGCRQVIISGGIKSFLDGYYLINKCQLTAVYGQASAFLKHAGDSYSTLKEFVQTQLEGIRIAQAFLQIK